MSAGAGATRRLGAARISLAGEATQIAARRQRAGVDRLGDRRDGHAEVERRLRRPAPGALLLRLVENGVD